MTVLVMILIPAVIFMVLAQARLMGNMSKTYDEIRMLRDKIPTSMEPVGALIDIEDGLKMAGDMEISYFEFFLRTKAIIDHHFRPEEDMREEPDKMV